MMYFLRSWHVVCLLVTLFILAPPSIANAANFTDDVTDVPVDKTWTITFNSPVIESSVTSSSLYVIIVGACASYFYDNLPGCIHIH